MSNCCFRSWWVCLVKFSISFLILRAFLLLYFLDNLISFLVFSCGTSSATTMVVSLISSSTSGTVMLNSCPFSYSCPFGLRFSRRPSIIWVAKELSKVNESLHHQKNNLFFFILILELYGRRNRFDNLNGMAAFSVICKKKCSKIYDLKCKKGFKEYWWCFTNTALFSSRYLNNQESTFSS